MQYINHVISTKNEKITPFGGYCVSSRPDHHGIDVTDSEHLELSQNVYNIAFEDGVVKTIRQDDPLFGNAVDIAHDFNGKKYLTRYMYMKKDSILVTEGDKVEKGQKLGIMSNTGKAESVHLHFEVMEDSDYHDNGVYANPELYLTGEKNMRSTAPSAKFTVQIGAFTTMENAERFALELELKGYSAIIGIIT